MAKFNSLRFQMSLDCATRLALIAEGVDYKQVYPAASRNDPAFDEDFLIGTLEEAANVWKTQPKNPRVPLADDTEPGEPDHE